MASERPEKGGRLRRALGLRDRDRTPMLAPCPSYDHPATGDVRILPSASDPDVPASPPAEEADAATAAEALRAQEAVDELRDELAFICERCGRPPGRRRLPTTAAALCATHARREARR